MGSRCQSSVELATDERADLVAMGTHRRSGVSGILLGSVAERVVRFAPCPVLTIRRPE
jgi:nucleotide-binding universal stress UspA family protein